MPDIRVVDQKFYAKLNNGDFYDSNLTDFSQHLKGGVLEEIKAIFKVQVGWSVVLGSYRYVYDSSASTLKINQEGLNWESKGFSIGDEVKYSVLSDQISDPQCQIKGFIVAITGGELLLDNVTQTKNVLQSGTFKIEGGSDDIVTGLTDKTALKYDYGLIENNEPINFLSKLTNTDQTYLFEGVGIRSTPSDPSTRSTNFVDGKSFGNNKAGYSGSSRVSFVGYVKDEDYLYNEDTTQEFIIEHIFKINPFYRDGELDSIKGIDVPPLDIFNGNMSLKYVFQTEFRSVLTNPNTSMISDYDTQLGSVGYFNESYNGYENQFSIDNNSINYSINGNSVDRIDINETTTVSFQLNTENMVNSSSAIVVGHSSIIDSNEYISSKDVFDVIWSNDLARIDVNQSGGFSFRDIIQNLQMTNIDGFSASVSFTVQFSTSQKSRLKNNQDYILFAQVFNPYKDIDNGSKVTLLLDVNYYNKNTDVSGLFDFDKFEQYPHPEPFDEGVSVGFTDSLTFNESGMMADGRFWVLNSANLNSLKFDIAVYQLQENTWDSLRSLDIDLSDQVLVNGIQQIELNSTRGYVLKENDIFNFLKVTTDNNDGTKQYYNIQVGYKIPWQSNIAFENAPSVFYDKTKSFNGLNQKSSNYSMVDSNYGIKVLFDAIVDSTNYVKTSEEIKVYDYDEDDQAPTAFSCEIKTYDIEENELANNIIQSEYTQVRAVFTPLVPPTFTESVDFTEVGTIWNRYAHGSKFQISTFERMPNWLNDQADNLDIFTGFNKTPSITKNSTNLYTSTQDQILANDNLGAVYGCYSLDKYEYYSIEGTMFSSSIADDDVIKYDMAFYVDENGVEHTLSLCATSGGVVLDINPNFNPNSLSSQVFYFPNNPSQEFCNVALVYNYGKRDCVQLDSFFTTESRDNWANVGDCKFKVNRSSDDFVVDIDWLIKGNQFNHTFNLDLSNNPLTQKFKGFQNIGFSFFSQDLGGFKDVNLTKPEGNFYSIIRIEPKNSQSDNTINEISTLIEAPENNLLTQITGDEKKATLSYNGSQFICQCLIDTSNLESGQEYDFSTELRLLNLEE
jgi:hypothetical protein